MNDAPPRADASSDAEALALLAAARRDAERASDGTPIPLQLQDRRLWDRGRIAEALSLVDRAFASPGVGACTLRAAIDALHAQAERAEATDWRRIAAVYELLAEIDSSPEVAAERAFARSRCGLDTTPRGSPVDGAATSKETP